MSVQPWRASFHGGHSWPFCDHAKGNLREMLDAAVARGMQAYGVSEHAPRLGKRFLYPSEIEWGWDLTALEDKFQAYFETLDALIPTYRGDMEVLRGFEIEIVPKSEWVSIMKDYRTRYNVEYVVGSVHYVDEVSIDSFAPQFEEVLLRYNSLTALACAYYEHVADMVFNFEPEIVGHFDLIRKFGQRYGTLDDPAIRSAAQTALEEIKLRGGILDINTSPYRRGEDYAYPAPWILEAAKKLDIPMTFGDDSHDVPDVNAGLDQGRAYLLEHGIQTITHLRRNPNGGPLQRRPVSIALSAEEKEHAEWTKANTPPPSSTSKTSK